MIPAAMIPPTAAPADPEPPRLAPLQRLDLFAQALRFLEQLGVVLVEEGISSAHVLV